ncbi:MAG: aromatic ring-hydroxylating dioxygenase subunit alpha [Acidimicrobiales bacterium]
MLVTAEPELRRYFYPVAFATEARRGPIGRRLLGTELVIWPAADGTFSAALDRCPHRDARLSCGGDLHEGDLRCPYHHWTFGADGRCTAIPQQPSTPIPPRAALQTFPCVERYSWVWVCLDPEPLGGIPDIAEYGAEGWRLVDEFDDLWDCSAPHLIDNNFDPAHIAVVHRNSFGATGDYTVPVAEVERIPTGLVARTRIGVAGRPGESAATERRTDAELHVPFLGVFRINYPDGLVHIMAKACTPVDDGHTRLLQFVLRNDTEADRPGEDIIAFDSQVAKEDKAVLEHCWTDYHLELTGNVHLRIDRGSVELRRLWAEVCAGTWRPVLHDG